jgi:glycosyltransferase involved in cell wall biosynthesis
VSSECRGLRVAFVSGNLGQGGAEKQAVYIVRALREAGATVKVYFMRRGEQHEPALKALGFDMTCLGDHAQNPLLRILVLVRDLRRFRPHVVQSGHFWANYYSGIGGRACGAVSIGALRSSLSSDLKEFRLTGRWLLRLPAFLIANSESARLAAEAHGLRPSRTLVLPNAIDLAEMDAARPAQERAAGGTAPVVAAVGRLVSLKRFDRFLSALALARREVGGLTGLLVGDGPERSGLERRARELGLLDGGLRFAGRRDDVPSLLWRADMLALTSDIEGFPNVILEAMAARLPVVTTPAGDAPRIVEEGVTGFVVPMDDVPALAARLVELARSPDLRTRLGDAGRRRAVEQYGLESLPTRLLALYQRIAQQADHRALVQALESRCPA